MCLLELLKKQCIIFNMKAADQPPTQSQPSVAARALRSNPESWNAYREAHAAAKGGITIPSVASRESRKLLSKDINEFANSKAFHALGEVPRNRVAFEEIGRRASFGALLGGPIGAILSAAKATALRYKNRL
tara:strand:- start:11053 stop:11448 length:396 start_codon:yes stop_codon:yes gene_type:complete